MIRSFVPPTRDSSLFSCHTSPLLSTATFHHNVSPTRRIDNDCFIIPWIGRSCDSHCRFLTRCDGDSALRSKLLLTNACDAKDVIRENTCYWCDAFQRKEKERKKEKRKLIGELAQHASVETPNDGIRVAVGAQRAADRELMGLHSLNL